MRTFDFAPPWRSTIGFDHVADLASSALRHATGDNHPPGNIGRFEATRVGARFR